MEARLTDLLDSIEASPCGDEESVKKVVRKPSLDEREGPMHTGA